MSHHEPQPYPFVLKEAVADDFCHYVCDLIRGNIERFEVNTGGPSRRFLKMDYVSPEGDQLLFAAKERLAAHYGLGEYIVTPHLKDFVGYITEGGCIHPHVDPDLPGKRHVRINVLVSQPKGCFPLMDGVPIAVSAGDAWLNLASKVRHATTPVEGAGFRSALSFGYQIDPHRGDELLRLHREWLRTCRPAKSRSPAPDGAAGSVGSAIS